MDEFSEVDEVCLAEVEHIYKSFTDDSWQVAVCQHGDSVDTLALVVTLGDEVLVDIFEVRDGYILFKLFVLQNCVIHQLDLFNRF